MGAADTPESQEDGAAATRAQTQQWARRAVAGPQYGVSTAWTASER